MNKAQLIGNLGKDVELRTTQSGKVVGSVSLATNKTFTDQAGNKTKQATFHNLVIWGKAAEIFAQYTHKGSKVYVEGEISNRSYDGQDGVKHYVSEIMVQEFEFLDSKPADVAAPRATTTAPMTAAAAPKRYPDQAEPNDEEEIRVERIPF